MPHIDPAYADYSPDELDAMLRLRLHVGYQLSFVQQDRRDTSRDAVTHHGVITRCYSGLVDISWTYLEDPSLYVHPSTFRWQTIVYMFLTGTYQFDPEDFL